MGEKKTFLLPPEVKAKHSDLVARLTKPDIEAVMVECDAMGAPGLP
jgi:hypothetical protein